MSDTTRDPLLKYAVLWLVVQLWLAAFVTEGIATGDVDCDVRKNNLHTIRGAALSIVGIVVFPGAAIVLEPTLNQVCGNQTGVIHHAK